MSSIHQFKPKDIRRKLAELEGTDINDFSEWEQRERVLARRTEGKALTGLKLPWSKTHDKVRLRPGEVSVWAGHNGHNKSTLLAQVATYAAQETRVAIASFEMDMEDTANLMAQHAAGTADVDTRWLNDFCSWSKDRIFIYDRLDTVPTDVVLSGVDYMGEQLGCGLIVIDSLMMCGVADDMERERAFMQTLTGLAKVYQTHIAVAHHMRKPPHGDETGMPSKFDLRGNGGIADLAQSIFICWQDKAKKEIADKIDEGVPLSTDELARWDKVKDYPDQILKVAKQRNARFEGGLGLWQHSSRQFIGSKKHSPMSIEIPRLEVA